MKLDQARILLTGASGGIGQALARHLAAQGARLLLQGRNTEQLTQLAASLPHPEQHQIIAADLCDPAGRNTLLTQIADLSPLNVVINNAGTNQFAWLEQQSEAQIHQQIQLNLEVPILLSRAVLPYLAPQGVIMNIGSSLGSIGYPGYSVYCASKFALRGFSEALNRELQGSGRQVLYFAPRATKTSLNSATVNAMNEALGTQSDSADVVALQAVDALSRNQLRRWVGWPEKLFVRLNALFPHLVDKAIAKQLPIIHRFAHASQKGD
ncbi:SDR family oxidoreductase [Tolumonas lignilytica]|uniref:SDR family oxidoreductase n=1 Tax=Tolumonas lignilytica TaxID=1283284 RepID=UPI000466239B|nr:SDR family oxidoreductase [Tolumonas lignilytica]